MNFATIGRLAGVLALTAGLAGCIDMTAEMEILSETTGKSTTITTMGAEFYPMMKQMAEQAGDDASTEDGFCLEEGGVLVENGDGSATCTTVKEGDFATLTESGGANEDATFTVVSPGIVRVAFKTEGMSGQVTEGQDAETAQMMKAYFEGHTATLRVKGNKVTETNMILSGDGKSAEVVIPFVDLLEGTVEFPAEFFAVVDTR